ncbi:MAG: ABC transporter substrate-binding protein [Opitutales bacterium]|jgi:iron complex transport system substrate-binding protein
MNTKRILGVALATIVVVSTACAPRHKDAQPDVSDEAFSFRMTDDGGREVVLSKRPQTIVSLAPSLSEMVITLGMRERLRGVTQWCDRPEADAVERIGNMSEPDMERIITMRPDLVLGTEMTPRHIYDTLEAAGIPCIMFKHQGFDDVMADMKTLADALGERELGRRVVEGMEARRREILSRVPVGAAPVKVALLYDLDSMGSAGRGSWVDDMLGSLGLDNIANRAESSWPRLSREALLTEQPRYIILPLPLEPDKQGEFRARAESLKNDPVWGRVEAVRNGGMILMPANLLNIPGPRTLDAMSFIADRVYGTER